MLAMGAIFRRYASEILITKIFRRILNHFDQLLYISCDFIAIRLIKKILTSPFTTSTLRLDSPFPGWPPFSTKLNFTKFVFPLNTCIKLKLCLRFLRIFALLESVSTRTREKNQKVTLRVCTLIINQCTNS